MRWHDALNRCEDLPVAVKLDAYVLSYDYLDGGREQLEERERYLRQAVDNLLDGDLPDGLGRQLFAWKNATYMLRRRSSINRSG